MPALAIRKGTRSLVLCMAVGMACAMAFCVSPQGFVGLSEGPASATSLLFTALGACFAFLFWLVFAKGRGWLGLAPLGFGLLFGVLNYLGTTLFAYDTWPFATQGNAGLALALLCALGQGLPMAAALALVDGWLRGGRHGARDVEKPLWEREEAREGTKPPRFGWVLRLYRRHTALFSALLLGLCWLPYLVVFFPGTLSWDMGEMLHQFFGLREMDNWHGVFLTWVLGACFALGRLLQGDTLGTLLFMLLQTAVLAAALGQAVALLRRLGLRPLWQALALGFFGLCPIFGGYAQFVCKDTLFAALVLLLTLHTVKALREAMAWKDWIFYGIVTLLCCLVRTNGLYVALPTAVLVLAFGLRGKARLRAGAALGAALALAVGFSSLLVPALGIRDESASGLYSVAFQQSARLLRDHGPGGSLPQVTEQETAAIDAVLPADQIAALYQPWISDPVKYTFRQYGQGAAVERPALATYRAAWMGMAGKYALTYLESFLAGNSGYYAFLPKLEAGSYNDQAGNRFMFEMHPQIETNLDVHTRYQAPERWRSLLALAARGWRHIPGLALLYSCATYTWLLAGAGISLLRQRRYRHLLAFAPALFAFASCLLSPVNDYFRYFLPVAACAAPLLGFSTAQAGPVKGGKEYENPDFVRNQARRNEGAGPEDREEDGRGRYIA